MNRASIADLRLEDKNIKHNALIINQTNNSNVSVDEKHNIKMLNSCEIGTSNSRNMALANAEGEICIFADDDIAYVPNYEDIIKNSFSQYPDVDIITFQIKTPDGTLFKDNYMKSQRMHNRRTVMKCASVEIAFRRKAVLDANLSLDLEFGLGSRYRIHDDVIFLADALKCGLKLMYIPIPIVVHPKESSGTMYNNFLVTSKGAAFARMFGFGGYFIDILYSFKKKSEYKYKYGFIDFLKLMIQGSKEFLSSH